MNTANQINSLFFEEISPKKFAFTKWGVCVFIL